MAGTKAPRRKKIGGKGAGEANGSVQQNLVPDVDGDRIPEIETAAEELYSIRTKRINLNADEDEAQTMLAGLMQEHELTIYKTKHGEIVTLEPGKVKVKIRKAEVDGKGIDE